jgi:hypothetical protein
MLTLLVVGLLLIWLFITVLNQFDLLPNRLLRLLSVASAAPNWRFFAPNPSTWDYSLFYRDELPSKNALTKFMHLPIGFERKLIHFLWNPDKRKRKVLSDCMRSLHRLAQEEPNADLNRTVPYVILRNYTLSHQGGRGAKRRQFLVVAHRSVDVTDDIRPVLLSDFHSFR